MSARFFDPRPQFADADNVLLANGTIAFYDTQTDDEADFYSDEDLTTAYDNPYTFGSDGRIPPIWLEDGKAYRIIVKDADGVTLFDEDPFYGSPANGTFKPIASIAALRLLEGASDGQSVWVASYYGDGNGGGGPFYWKSSSSADDNGGTVIKPTATVGNGRWLRPNQNTASTLEFGCIGDDSTDNTDAFANAVESLSCLKIDSGVFQGAISVQKSDFSIIGEGSSVSIVKNPDGSDVNAIEVGETGAGNAAPEYENFSIRGVGINGNRDNISPPAVDVTGQGLILTKVSNWSIQDVVAKDCFNAGVNIVINSNYGNLDCIVENCGTTNGTGTGPGFDMNSSKFINGRVVAKECAYGARILDNCWGINLDVTSEDAEVIGFVYTNQSVNESYANNIRVNSIRSGVHGATIISKNDASIVHINAIESGANGVYVVGNTSDASEGCIIFATTRESQEAGLLCEGSDHEIHITSQDDGRGGSPGDFFGIEFKGTRNTIYAKFKETTTFQARGLVFRAGADNNEIVSYSAVGTGSGGAATNPYTDAGENNRFNRGDGVFEVSIDGGGGIDIPLNGSQYIISAAGSANTLYSPEAHLGHEVTLLATDVTTISDGGGNIDCGSNFVMAAGDTITLVTMDGLRWKQKCRSAN